MTQAALAEVIGVTQGNISHYENGQAIPADIARRIISCAAERELGLTFDDIYIVEASENTVLQVDAPYGKSNEEIRREVDLGYRQPADPQRDAA
jgi:transcriptional regulator with XRE-family HTH domain